MRNFAGKSNPEKKVWGVLGKQETFYSPEQFQDKGRIIPLNANPLEAWDTTRSRYIRRPQMPPLANDGQQAGVVPQGTSTPDVSPTPTGTPAVTPSPTPSSTPYILPETPALWYDATNIGSIDYISSGGTDYVATWRSVGTYQKAVTGVTTNTMPIWSGSSQMPGSPLVVRWNKNSNAALRQFLTQRFDSTPIPQSGFTTFIVFANPGYDYTGVVGAATGVGFNLFMASGNTTGGFTIPAALNYNMLIGNSTNISLVNAINGVATTNLIPNWSATSLNDKFLFTQISEFDNNVPYFELNQSGGTQQLPITASTTSPISSIALGIGFAANGAIQTTGVNPGIEMGEIMIFNRILSPSEQEQVQDYLRDKWRYDEWASPVPTPTPTNTPTSTTTPTPTVTQTQTSSPTPSPSALASGTTEAIAYLNKVVTSGGTVDATASAATITLFTSLVSNGLWDKIYAMYPTLGGVAASHAIDAKSSIYELTFNGGWTHSSLGMTPNGTNGYANGLFNPSTVIGNNNTSHLSIYVNQQGGGDRIYDMGINSNGISLTDMFNLTAKRSSGTGDNTLFDAGDFDPSGFGRVSTTSQTSASGMTVGSVRSTTDRTLYRNGSNIATQTNSRNITYANGNLFIGAQNDGGAANYFSTNTYAFATIGSGLTNTDIVNLSDIINTYQTSLGRNTY
jgi:hypothetical protein